MRSSSGSVNLLEIEGQHDSSFFIDEYAIPSAESSFFYFFNVTHYRSIEIDVLNREDEFSTSFIWKTIIE